MAARRQSTQDGDESALVSRREARYQKQLSLGQEERLSRAVRQGGRDDEGGLPRHRLSNGPAMCFVFYSLQSSTLDSWFVDSSYRAVPTGASPPAFHDRLFGSRDRRGRWTSLYSYKPVPPLSYHFRSSLWDTIAGTPRSLSPQFQTDRGGSESDVEKQTVVSD